MQNPDASKVPDPGSAPDGAARAAAARRKGIC